MTLWEKMGEDFVTFSHRPLKERLAISRAHNGVKIFSCCEMEKIKKTMSLPMQHLINQYYEDEAEKFTIREKFKHAVFKGEPK